MKRSFRISAIVLAVLLLAVSCREKEGRIIPRAKMAKIYADMLLTDQWIQSNRQYSRQADTSLVYGEIFEKYGYTVEDYRVSVEHYLYDTERYGRMMKQTVAILESKQAELKKKKEIQDLLEEKQREAKNRPPVKVYYMSGLHNKDVFMEGDLKFFMDTTGGEWTFDPAKDIDTLYQGPMLIFPEPIDSVKFKADSIALADSLAKLDSLARVDSLARLDSLAKETVEEIVEKVEDLPAEVNRPVERAVHNRREKQQIKLEDNEVEKLR